MLKNKTNLKINGFINSENNNFKKKSNHKKLLGFYRNKIHYWLEINKAIK